MAKKTELTSGDAPLLCARCTAELMPGSGDFFRITIEAVADPFPPVIADEEPGELRAKIERLLGQMEDVSQQEAMDQVHRRLMLYLCGPCYRQWIENPAGETNGLGHGL